MKKPFSEIAIEARLAVRTPCKVSDIPFYLSQEWATKRAPGYVRRYGMLLTSDNGGLSGWDAENLADLEKDWASVDPDDLPLIALGICRNEYENVYNIFRYLAQAILAGEVSDD